MKKNYTISFKTDAEGEKLLAEVLEMLNRQTNIEIGRSDFIRVVLRRACMELKTGDLTSSELLYNKK